MARRTGVVAVAVLALLAAACAETPQITYDGSSDPNTQTVVLTPDGVDSYWFTSGPGFAEFQAPGSNQGANLRQAFWPSGAPDVVDGQSCATWRATSEGDVQEGAVLRLSMAGGRTRAITITKNIAYYTWWVFNVHVWDTAAPQPYTQVGQVDLGQELWPNGQLQPLPWHFCARVIGDFVDLKVWHDPEAEPAWGDSVHARTVKLPPGWIYPGKDGWYIGHLPPGGFARFDTLRTWRYAFGPPPSTRAEDQGSKSPAHLSTVALG